LNAPGGPPVDSGSLGRQRVLHLDTDRWCETFAAFAGLIYLDEWPL